MTETIIHSSNNNSHVDNMSHAEYQRLCQDVRKNTSRAQVQSLIAKFQNVIPPIQDEVLNKLQNLSVTHSDAQSGVGAVNDIAQTTHNTLTTMIGSLTPASQQELYEPLKTDDTDSPNEALLTSLDKRRHAMYDEDTDELDDNEQDLNTQIAPVETASGSLLESITADKLIAPKIADRSNLFAEMLERIQNKPLHAITHSVESSCDHLPQNRSTHTGGSEEMEMLKQAIDTFLKVHPSSMTPREIIEQVDTEDLDQEWDEKNQQV